MGWLARRRSSRLLVRWFVRAYKVDLSEASGDLSDYATLSELFTRTLKPGVRPITTDPTAIVSPVDGTVAAVGLSTNRQVQIAPDRSLSLSELLGEPIDDERQVAVLYLSPKDYHRVHLPREGQITGWSYIPGTLWPVFPAAVRKVRGLFSRNERCCVQVHTSEGPLSVVLIGAFGVGRISLSFTDLITNTGGTATSVTFEEPHPIERGDHLGTFHLGSTVILVAPPGAWTWSVHPGDPVRVGAAIGHSVLRLTDDSDAR